jgi:hypothetical protein
MFDSKQKALIKSAVKPVVKSTGTKNPFVEAAMQRSSVVLSGNGAKKYSTTGNEFVDQFGKLGEMKAPRSYTDISSDMSVLWASNKKATVDFTLYVRMITRTTMLPDGTKTTVPQRGSGLRYEGIMRMMWLHVNHPDTFWKNIPLFVAAGSWKDIIMLLSYDLQYNGWDKRLLNWDQFGKMILAGLENPVHSELIKKYLPAIKSNTQCKTIEAQADNLIGKWLCSLLFGNKGESSGWTYKKYRQLKSSGTAHEWQQLISQGKHQLVNFNTVHGRALAQMVSGKYITNNGLETRYNDWIDSQPVAKFTGYVHELFKVMPSRPFQIQTLNKQFDGLVETAKKGATQGTSLIVVRDTSGSMSSSAAGTSQSCYDIGKALALFFSEMLPEGEFANSWIEFNSDAKMHQWKGSTAYEKWVNDSSNYIGGTDFQSVIKLFVKMKQKGIDESQFPTGILCISDSEFNPTQLGGTNVRVALGALRNGGFSEEYIAKFKIVLWNLQSNYYGEGTGSKFETYGDVDNVYYFSGYDGSVIAFLTGVEGQISEPKNARELFEAAMNQEIMGLVTV